MKGVATPKLLIQGQYSPHTYTLRPSDAKLLHTANIIFWIGSDYETHLTKSLQTLPKQSKIIEMSQNKSLTRLPYREDVHHHEHTHAHSALDPHVWLDPLNAKAITQQIAQELSKLDPQDAETYQQNAQNLLKQLDMLHSQLSIQLKPVAQKPFMVMHDAYQYLENRFGLAVAGTLIISADFLVKPSRLTNIQKDLKTKNIRCVFQEPQFHSPQLSRWFKEQQVELRTLDPLGTDNYFEMMKTLSDQISQCLSS